MKNLLIILCIAMLLAGSLVGCAAKQKPMEERVDEARKNSGQVQMEEESAGEKAFTIVDTILYILAQ